MNVNVIFGILSFFAVYVEILYRVKIVRFSDLHVAVPVIFADLLMLNILFIKLILK